ncbi:MAG: ferredoxin [Candidatus Hydrogenedentota bacterium]|nr:MAG: ferredoxin [Candidatus Hydrogenedentota bacterium]
MPIKVTHLREKCIGCGSCAETDPNHWTMSSKDGKAILKKSQKKGKYFIRKIDEIFLEDTKQAAELCPVNIIEVHDHSVKKKALCEQLPE